MLVLVESVARHAALLHPRWESKNGAGIVVNSVGLFLDSRTPDSQARLHWCECAIGLAL
jgi:hypothetical protein